MAVSIQAIISNKNFTHHVSVRTRGCTFGSALWIVGRRARDAPRRDTTYDIDNEMKENATKCTTVNTHDACKQGSPDAM